jgi:hypothetical protein
MGRPVRQRVRSLGGAADRIVGADAGVRGMCAASGLPDIAAVETVAGALSAAARPS